MQVGDNIARKVKGAKDLCLVLVMAKEKLVLRQATIYIDEQILCMTTFVNIWEAILLLLAALFTMDVQFPPWTMFIQVLQVIVCGAMDATLSTQKKMSIPKVITKMVLKLNGFGLEMMNDISK